MGQNQVFGCKSSNQTVFVHELKVYQWRADSKFNSFIPRVYFKSALAQLQQQKFSQFLQQQQNCDYLEISKFKQQLQSVEYSGNDQVILFQKYYCSLAHFIHQLPLEQLLYILQGLLSGFQEIKKLFQTIFIDPTCCFLTNEGAIRAWINPNPKSNYVWKEHLGQTNLHNIIERICRMAEETAKPSNQTLEFIHHLCHILNFTPNCNFIVLRRWINEYCYNHNIQVANCVNLSERKREEAAGRDSKIYQRNVSRTEGSDPYKENDLLLSTHQSQMFRFPRSLEKSGPPAIFEVRNINLPVQSIKKSCNTTSYHFPKTASDIYSKNISQTQSVKFSVLVQTQPLQSVNSSEAHKNPAKQLQEMKRINSTLVFNKEERAPKKPTFLQRKPFLGQNSKKPSFLQNPIKLLQKKADFMNDQPSIRKQERKVQRSQELCEKKSMKVSIMQHFPEQPEVRKESRYKTFAQHQYRQQQTKKDQFYFSRPWITTKTITKLISENEDQHSMKQSIGSSSDYYNHSVYSGVLTQMGREVGRPINIARSKTLKESQL